jgi:two-component system invasion response regulator UvrY
MELPQIGDGNADITCLLVDDNEPLLDALETLLPAEGIEIVGKARSGLEALALLRRRAARAVVLDLRLPDLSGLEVARKAAEIAPDTAVILYTTHADSTLVRDALDAGAKGVVRKHTSPANLLCAIRAVAEGDVFIDPQLERT